MWDGSTLHVPLRLDDRFHPLEVARQERTQSLGIGRLAQCGRARHANNTVTVLRCSCAGSTASRGAAQ
jgi:hypothetical protein